MSYRHAGSGPFTVGDIPEDERGTVMGQVYWQDSGLDQVIERAIDHGANLNEIGRTAKETAIRVAMQRENGNLQRAARALGVTDRTLQIRRARWANAS